MNHDIEAPGASTPADAGTSGERVVYSFPKNSREEVRATLSTFHGRRIANVRVYRADDEDNDRPTRKGIALDVRTLPKLLEAVQALVAAAAAEEGATL